MTLSLAQAEVLQALVDRRPPDATYARAIAECLSAGYLFEADGEFIITLDGIDALRPLQHQIDTCEALRKIHADALAFEKLRGALPQHPLGNASGAR